MRSRPTQSARIEPTEKTMNGRSASALTRRLGGGRATELFDHVGKFGNVLEPAVNRCETDIGDRIETAQLVHHEFAELLAAHFPLAGSEQLIFDAGDRRVDRVSRNRPLAQRELHAGDDLA